jgi:gamma-glutamyl-gamma-aminobutyrate hydrolase PuuD
MAPIIGITAWPRHADLLGSPQHNQTVPTSYVSSVRRAGGTAVVLPVVPDDEVDDLLDAVDGVVLTGGGDLDPASYGAERAAETDRVDPDRDRFDSTVTLRVLERHTPALAVCRGIQILNVVAGGTLDQHVPRHTHLDLPKDTAHEVEVVAGTRLAAVVGPGPFEVNSLHHQGIDRVGGDLLVTATADDGLVEGLERVDDGHILAVQWHPELLRHRPEHLALFEDLVERATP